MASPIKRIMSLKEDRNGSPLRAGTKKILKILRRPSFTQARKHSDCNGDDLETPAAPKDQTPKKVNARNLEELRSSHKELTSALLYFKLLIEKSTIEIIMAKIPDNTSLVLESIISIDNMLDGCLRLHGKNLLCDREGISRESMQTSVAELVKWTDQLLVRGNVTGKLDEGLELAKRLESDVQKLVEVATRMLQTLDVNDEIRNSIFLIQGSSSEDIPAEGDSPWVSRRDSGISEESIGAESPPPKPPLPKTLRDSGRGSYNNIGDSSAGHLLRESSPRHSCEGLLSQPNSISRANSRYHRSHSQPSSKHSDLSLNRASDTWSYKTPVGSQEEFNRSTYFSARSSMAEEFQSCEDGDCGSEYDLLEEEQHEENAVIQASFVCAYENGERPPPPRKKTFQVYIELVDGYTHPSEEILKRPTSVYDGYQESFRRSIAPGNASPRSPVLNGFPFRGVGDQDRSQSFPVLEQAGPPWFQQSSDHNRNLQQSGGRHTKLHAQEEEERRHKESTFSTSSSSLSSADEDDSTPALDSLDVSRYLVYRQDKQGSTLVGGAIDALIVEATNSSKKNLVFHEAFLTTYRTFISPMELINKLLYRERRFRERGHNKASKNSFFMLLRVVDELTGKVERSILEKLMKEVYQLLVQGDLVFAKILRNQMLPKCEHYYRIQSAAASVASPSPAVPGKFTILDFHAEDLAKQLALMDAKNFQAVEMPEILSWGKDQKDEATANLIAFTEHFNKLSYWSRSYVLSFDKQPDREKVYMKFLKVMKHLRRFNDFNAFLAILSALDCSAVRRLEWPKQYLDTLAEYTDLIDNTSSFRAYRAAITTAEPPCIPYLGLILQDVTFVCHGNRDELPDGKVNFVKRWQLFNILDSVRKFKLSGYDFVWDESICQFFGGFDDYFSEEDLYQRSLELKPRSS